MAVDPHVHYDKEKGGFYYEYDAAQMRAKGYEYVAASTERHRDPDSGSMVTTTTPAHWVDPKKTTYHKDADGNGVREPVTVTTTEQVPRNWQALKKYGLWDDLENPNAPIYQEMRARGMQMTPENMASFLFRYGGLGTTTKPEEWGQALSGITLSPEMQQGMQAALRQEAKLQSEMGDGVAGKIFNIAAPIALAVMTGGFGAAAGLGTIGAGALAGGAVGGMQSGTLQGALTGALTGAAGGALTSAVSPAVSSAVGGGTLGNAAGGAAVGAGKSLLTGGDLVQGALSGATNSAIKSGVDSFGGDDELTGDAGGDTLDDYGGDYSLDDFDFGDDTDFGEFSSDLFDSYRGSGDLGDISGAEGDDVLGAGDAGDDTLGSGVGSDIVAAVLNKLKSLGSGALDTVGKALGGDQDAIKKIAGIGIPASLLASIFLEKNESPLTDVTKQGVQGALDEAKAFAQTPTIGLTPSQKAAIALANSNVGAYQPYLDKSGALIDRATAGITDEDLARYENPYLRGVLDPQIRDIEEAAARRREQLKGIAAMSGQDLRTPSTDPNRFNIEDELLDRETLRAIGDASGKAYADSFNTAAGLAGKDLDRSLQGSSLYEGIGKTTGALDAMDFANLQSAGALERLPQEDERTKLATASKLYSGAAASAAGAIPATTPKSTATQLAGALGTLKTAKDIGLY